jgi:hypothetical protein
MNRKIIVIMIVMAVAGTVNAATEAEKRAAIDAGLAYLASTQGTGTSLAPGSWPAGGIDYQLSATGSALLSFLEEKPNWELTANAAAYQAVVDKGMNFLLNNVSVVNISPQTYGNPDGDGNGIGVKLYPGGANSRDTYVTGLVLPAIASTGTPDALVTTGPLANAAFIAANPGSGVGGAWTYKDVVQNTVDYFAYGQNEVGSARGGWRYYANYGNSTSSDQSTTQWPVIALAYATKMGVATPAFVKTELAVWTNYIQNTATGAAGYTSPTSYYGRMNETGALLLEQAFLGWTTGTVAEQAKVDAALNFIEANWLLGPPSSYEGNFGHPYGMWAIYKGLEASIGLDDETTITANLHADPGDVDNPNHEYNWWEDYCEWLVNSQGVGAPAAGAWAGFSSWNTWLATPWYINILAATKISDVIPPVPVPGAFLLGSIGLAFACRKLQRRKEL